MFRKTKCKHNLEKQHRHRKKNNKYNQINEVETAEEKLQLGSLYIALQQMRRAAKLNLSAMERILNIVKENPSMAFLKTIIKPMCEMVPEDPLNAVVNMIHVPKNTVPGITKYNVTEVQTKKKLFLLKYCKMENLCTSAQCVRKSWYHGVASILTLRVEHIIAHTAKKSVNLLMVSAIILKLVKRSLLMS